MKLYEMKKIIPNVFEDVKKAVYECIEKRRAGLMLGLVDLGIYRGYFIGAFHILTSNFIILNKTPLKLLQNKTHEIIYAYIFTLLLHEYLHTLGFINEKLCRRLTYEISKDIYGEQHLITYFAKGGIKNLFPDIIFVPYNFQIGSLSKDLKIELVDGFDNSNCTYFC